MQLALVVNISLSGLLPRVFTVIYKAQGIITNIREDHLTLNVLKIITPVLKSILDLMGSQCKDCMRLRTWDLQSSL